ncbi:MAG: 50S ribosomal protein L4 [bacterium]|nr:50S ribosomal protein L4 [bacterium]
MPQVSVYDIKGEVVGTRELNDAVFGAEVNRHAVHSSLVRQMAGRRAGNADTKTRAEVSGGGKKPWRQKGTGRARHGSTRSPIWTGGGIVFGPHPRSYAKGLPKKVRRLALISALSGKAGAGAVKVMDGLVMEQPKTKVMAELIEKFGTSGRVLLVLGGRDANIEKSVANITWVKAILVDNLNVFDILNSELLLLTKEAADRLEEAYVS